VSVAANLIPVIALTGDVLLIGVDITLLKVVGITVTIIGVLITQLTRRSSQ
jgi:drug/metabolite transporter (DMT)-like permease